MKKSRYTEERITVVLKQVELGVPLEEVCRKYGISKQTFYRWKIKYGGLSTTEVRRLKQLEEENRKLKQIVADLTLDKQILQDVLSKKAQKPAAKRELVAQVSATWAINTRRSCGLLRAHRSTQLYQSRRADLSALRMRMRELAMDRPRYGYRRVHVLLRREGWILNHKKLHRLYREEGIALRSRRRKKRAARIRVVTTTPLEVNQLWSMDFVSDTLADGRRIRVFTVLDGCSREWLAAHVEPGFTSSKITAVLDRIIARRGKPSVLRVDNGTEFTSNHFDAWAYQRKTQVDFIHPGRPVENGLIESFNGRLRDECLNGHWFPDLDEAKRLVEVWKAHYNEVRPHSSLGYVAPAAYAAELLAQRRRIA